MSIGDNQMENKNNNKKMFICAVIAMVVIAGGITAAISMSGKKSQAVFAEENVNEPVELPEDAADITDNVKIEEELSETEADMVEDWVAVYTTEYSDEESLIQLVKDTIRSADHQFEQAVQENGESSRIATLLHSIEDARINNVDFDNIFMPADTGFIVDSKIQSWTYWDVAGALGQCLFYQKNLEKDDLFTGEMLKRFVAYGVFNYDVEGINHWKVEGIVDALFPADIDFDVNFIVYFDHGNQQHAAIIGNVNGEYVVLDIIYADELDGILVKKEAQAEEPEVKPEVALPAEEEGNDTHVGNGYEGEKEGYIYIPGYGYIKDEGGPGEPLPGDGLPSYDDVKDDPERGNM